MESLGAIGLAANILQFVEFGTKVIRSTGEIYDSINGTTPQNNSLEIVATSISDWCSRLTSPPVSSAQTDDEKIIYLLANECQKISQEILELTWKIKPKNRKSRTDVFISALRNGWHESTKHDLLARLETCRSQLSTQLGSLNRDEIKSRLKEVIRSVENNADEMISVRRKIDEINQGLNRLSLSSTVRHLLQSFLDIPLRAIAEHHILRSLSFGTMYQRFDQVQDAHVKSFHWIFEEPTKHTPLHHKSMPSFVNWLAKEGGIFHISGKLGSGKSTLLKYLCDHGKTTENLDQWSQKDGKKLIFAQFFFWRAGDHDQKSVSGLLRSLLHDILQQRPDLIPSVFAQHWKYLKSLDWRVQPTLNLRVKDIRAAFDTLIHSPRLYENNKLCFFIDGLDEYEETAHEDYKDMVDMLFLWVNMAPNDVKLCVSSRELEDFRKAFSEDKKLRLHELTRNDMESFVRGRLENFDILSASGASIEDNKRALVATITDRADGIFLWVSLVLNSLRERLQYDCQLSSLIQHTENMPKEMEPLFRHLLESIDQCDPRAAYRTFAMVLKLKEYRQNLPLIAYSFLAEYENDPHFAIADDVNNWGPGSDRLAMAKAKVNGQCKGLLEYRIAVDPHYEASLSAPPILIERVHVVHRTVFDFLHEETLQFKMANYCKGFDVMDAICQTYLASFKLNSILDTRFIVRFRKENFADTAPFRFFEALDSYNIPTQKELHTHFKCEDYISWKISNDPTLFQNDGARFANLLIGALNERAYHSLTTLPLLIPSIKNGNFRLDRYLSLHMESAAHFRLWDDYILMELKFVPDENPMYRQALGEYVELCLHAGASTSGIYLSPARDNSDATYQDNSKYLYEFLSKECAGLDEIVDFWELENADRLKELIRNPALRNTNTQIPGTISTNETNINITSKSETQEEQHSAPKNTLVLEQQKAPVPAANNTKALTDQSQTTAISKIAPSNGENMQSKRVQQVTARRGAILIFGE